MKRKFYFVLSLFIILLFNSCSKNNLVGVNTPNLSDGSLMLKINKSAIPSDVQQITAELSRSGYDTLKTNANVIDDSLDYLSFEAVPIGEWHLNVDANNSEGKIIYSGESDITIIEDETIDVYLTLTPAGSSTGSIRIFVNWDNKWIDFYKNPVLTPTDNPDYLYAVTQPKVLYDNGIYKMWYLNLYSSARTNAWYAESSDGMNWHNVQNQPVLTPGDSGSWDDYSVYAGAVIKENNLFKMYYNGFQDQYEKWNIGLAVSQDGIHWEKNNEPVLAADEQEYQIVVSSVIKHNSIYYMYYTVRHYPYYSISLATSTDGINWSKYANNPIINSTKDWEGTGVFYPSVIYNQNRFEMIYMNADANSFGFAVSSDGINWSKNNSPVFTTNDTYNKWANRIAYPNFNNFNSKLKLYYTGYKNYDDGVIAVASK